MGRAGWAGAGWAGAGWARAEWAGREGQGGAGREGWAGRGGQGGAGREGIKAGRQTGSIPNVLTWVFRLAGGQAGRKGRQADKHHMDDDSPETAKRSWGQWLVAWLPAHVRAGPAA